MMMMMSTSPSASSASSSSFDVSNRGRFQKEFKKKAFRLNTPTTKTTAVRNKVQKNNNNRLFERKSIKAEAISEDSSSKNSDIFADLVENASSFSSFGSSSSFSSNSYSENSNSSKPAPAKLIGNISLPINSRKLPTI